MNMHMFPDLSSTISSTMRPTPLVSVVMPVKNGERFIDEAIGSILQQTVKRIELLVVVNGSTDKTLGIASRYATEDARVRVLESPESNIAMALNLGIEHAHAGWIARMDADDISLPERLERQLSVLNVNPDIAALGTWGWRIGSNGRKVSTFRLGPTTREEFDRVRNDGLIYLLSSSVVFNRQVAVDLGGFRVDYPPTEDIEFWTRIADNHMVLTLPEPLILYRIHTNAVSTLHFSTQIRNARRAKVNTVRRRSGLPELSATEFQQMEREKPRRRRLALWMHDQSQYCYRRGGGLLAASNPAGVFWVMGSFLLYPKLPINRLSRQIVTPFVTQQLHRRAPHTGSHEEA